MIFGRSVAQLILGAFVAVCVFILCRYLIPVLFALVSVVIPPEVVTVLALLVAVGAFIYARLP